MFKFVNNTLNDIVNNSNNQPNRLPASRTSLAENYIEGWEEIHMVVTFREACQYCAVIHRADVDESPSLLPHTYGEARRKNATPSCPKCQVEMPVFVHVG